MSKPFEIVLKGECKRLKSNVRFQRLIPICDTDLKDIGIRLTDIDFQWVHYAWDAVKSSNNPEGINYCDSQKKLIEKIPLEELCPPVKTKK